MKQRITLLILGLWILASCEGNTDYYFEVKNRTDTPIFVKTVNWSSDTSVTKIEKGGQDEVLWVNQRGGVINPKDLSDYLIFMEVYDSYGTMVNVDLLKNHYWSRNTEVRSKVPANYGHSYLLKLDENHFK